jgi:uncharacterized membrane protein
MAKRKVLLAGETWISAATHYKGFDSFGSTTIHSGAAPLIDALAGSDYELVHLSAQDAVEKFPFTLNALNEYAAVILSDIGANTLLLHPDVWLNGKTVPNRVKLIREWVNGGGGLVMAGGYLSYQGVDGRARWRHTAVEDVLPVDCLPHDDRLEVPEGYRADVVMREHALVKGMPAGEWPQLLGANEIVPKKRAGVEVVARLPADQGGHPLLVGGTFGSGRSVAWASDISPHWLPLSFVAWPGYKRLWLNVLDWVTRQS